MSKAVKSMYGMLAETATRYPHYTSLDYYGSTKTYFQLITEIRQTASVLSMEGVNPGDKVILCLPNIPQTVVFFYALNLLGAVPCMVHPLSAPAELDYYINLTQSRYLITLDMSYPAYKEVVKSSGLEKAMVTGVDTELPPGLKLMYRLKQGLKIPRLRSGETLLVWEEHSSTPAVDIKPYSFNNTDPALILFSGGTTGNPKAVLLSNNNMNALAEQVLDQIVPVPETDAMLCILPFFHGFGLGVCLHPVLRAGGRCILVPRFSKTEFARIVRTKRPAYIAGVPTLFQALLNSQGMTRAEMSFLKAAFCGGDTTPPALIDKFNTFVRARGGTASLREGYGLTECVTACTVMPAEEYRERSVGRPFAGTTIKIIDPETLSQRPPGAEGEICVSGPTVMLGYLNQEQETAATLKIHNDGLLWLHTGDSGWIDKDGYVYFRQRLKRIIKRSGYTVYPSQVEEVINSHPLVAESCVIGIPDQYSLQNIKAFVVYKGPVASDEETAEQLLKYISDRLIKWAVPSEIEFCSRLPLTRLGKISFAALENRERTRKSNSGAAP